MILALLQIPDAWTTCKVLAQGGREYNPVLAYLYKRFGILPVLVTVKTLVLMLSYFYLINQPYILGLFCVIYGVTIAHNYSQIKFDA
jgi:hypothetical protein